ncbi:MULTISPECIES: aspartate ammonia-lyase [Rhodococcus]|uniref:aspartate ammonia-lyase n=2 Tax=Rhodococcus opacus TaxID=37919 RepID=C1BD58_RHOOB|nr:MULTISPECIES: aspartate ammonia-lyase [Rhodococcus]EID81281.1 putative aspartate ammonia-lyase [Rhodococcus opacus RKJ300 = JCM 13270]KAF0957082.1 Aspartate ammonia-lyase [Rhodococcus sp. T7]KAF0959828.1 Aspartate ammonia-lyase [Rhodococcus sp. T7]QQZ19350.1 aspartate ammonia-lyase [Rhodococcus sp. 21391]UOT08053.1 aspartate ammonia-lyase [Rhodococcus opacus]
MPPPPVTRDEHDLLGTRPVSDSAYYGIHTLRAVENFAITGTPISVYPELIVALASVKEAAAQTNHQLGLLDTRRMTAIVEACREIRGGRFHDQFVVDVIQGGAGTSTNMNANEVIANRALEILGLPRGTYREVHPLEDVNLSQSTNDVYPTAIKVTLHFAIDHLRAAMKDLATEFTIKATEFHDVVMGRTQLQDAVPMTLGQEFGTYAVMVTEDADRLLEAERLVAEINLGGTAIGTGINTHPLYAETACEALRAITGLPLTTATDLIESTQDVGSFVQLSGVLKRTAVKLSKICNDLRLLSSGPRTGLGEINLPAVQAGSSIMPGKVNPVVPEVVNQVAYEVIGNDVTISLAAEGGQLQLNALEPIIASSLFQSLTHLSAACRALTERCVPDITANADKLRADVEHSIGIITALNPHIGYTAATSVAEESLSTGRSIPDIVVTRGLLTADQLERLLRPEVLVRPQQLEHFRQARAFVEIPTPDFWHPPLQGEAPV